MSDGHFDNTIGICTYLLEKLEKDNNLFWNQVFPYSEYFLPLYGLESHHVRCTRQKLMFFLLFFLLKDGCGYKSQKQPSRGVPRKRCPEDMQQIYRRTPMPKCLIIEITLRHGCSPVNLLHILRIPFPRNTSRWLLLKSQTHMKETIKHGLAKGEISAVHS